MRLLVICEEKRTGVVALLSGPAQPGWAGELTPCRSVMLLIPERIIDTKGAMPVPVATKTAFRGDFRKLK